MSADKSHVLSIGICDDLVPDATSPVMRNLFLPIHFSIFHCIVEEKVYQNGIYRRVWMLFENLPPYQFNTPYTTAYPTC
jgi:hypothetical protein